MPDSQTPIRLRIPGTSIPESLPEVPAEFRNQIAIRDVQAFETSAARA